MKARGTIERRLARIRGIIDDLDHRARAALRAPRRSGEHFGEHELRNLAFLMRELAAWRAAALELEWVLGRGRTPRRRSTR
jgi:hypothetical protein